MTRKTTRLVMVDTGFWVAKANFKDQYHDTANRIWDELSTLKTKVAVNDYIIDESVTFVNRLLGFEAAQKMYDFLTFECKVFWTDRQDCKACRDIFNTFKGALSVTDSMIVQHMREGDIKHLVSFDGQFERVKDIKRVSESGQMDWS